jgi:hypothetical protein
MRTNVGQTLSSVNPATSSIFSRLVSKRSDDSAEFRGTVLEPAKPYIDILSVALKAGGEEIFVVSQTEVISSSGAVVTAGFSP